MGTVQSAQNTVAMFNRFPDGFPKPVRSPVHILDNVIYEALGFGVGAADWPGTRDVTAVTLQLTSSVHQDELAFSDPLAPPPHFEIWKYCESTSKVQA